MYNEVPPNIDTDFVILVSDTCKQWKIDRYSINFDYSVDIHQNVSILGSEYQKLPFQIGIVSGYFSCLICRMVTFKHFPKKIGGMFRYIGNDMLATPENFDYLYQMNQDRMDIGDHGDPLLDAYQSYYKIRQRSDKINELLK